MVGAKATSVPNEYAVFEDVDGATGTNKQQQQQPLPKLLTVSLFFFFVWFSLHLLRVSLFFMLIVKYRRTGLDSVYQRQ